MPNRIIKETICTSDNLNEVSLEEEVFFYRLIVNCDDYGRLDARSQILLAKCFPLRIGQYTPNQIEIWLKNLNTAGLILLYEVDGKPYLEMKSWEKHQRVRSKKSKYPSCDSNKIQVNYLNEIKNTHVSNLPTDDSNVLTDDKQLPADNLLTNDSELLSNASVIQSNPIQSESKNTSQNTVCNDASCLGDDEEKEQEVDEEAEKHRKQCLELAELLTERILANNPSARVPKGKKLESWAKHVDYMIRLDKRTPDQIRDFIFFSQWHQFWKKNILSTQKLREQFDKLILEKQDCDQKRAAPRGNSQTQIPTGRITL